MFIEADSQSVIVVRELREPTTSSSKCFTVVEKECQVAYPKASHRQAVDPTVSARGSGQGILHPVLDSYRYPSTRI